MRIDAHWNLIWKPNFNMYIVHDPALFNTFQHFLELSSPLLLCSLALSSISTLLLLQHLWLHTGNLHHKVKHSLPQGQTVGLFFSWGAANHDDTSSFLHLPGTSRAFLHIQIYFNLNWSGENLKWWTGRVACTRPAGQVRLTQRSHIPYPPRYFICYITRHCSASFLFSSLRF